MVPRARRCIGTAGHGKVSSTPCTLPTPPFLLSSSHASAVHRRRQRRRRPWTSSSAAAPSTTARERQDAAPTSASKAIASSASATSHRHRPDHHRRRRPRGRTGLYQHAVVGNRIAARRRTIAGRHPAGRHPGDLRRRQLDGPAERPHEEAHSRGDGRHQVPDHLDDACRVPEGARTPRYLDQRRLLHRRDDHPRVRDWLGRQTRDCGRPRGDARARQAGDGGRCARHRQLAHLRARLLRVDRRVDRALQGRGAVSGQVHLAYPERRQPSRRGRRRTDSDQPRGQNSGRDLPPQGRRQGELVQAGHRRSR